MGSEMCIRDRFSSSPYVSGIFQIAAPELELRVSESVRGKFAYEPFKRNVHDSHSPLSHSATISAGFHSQMLWDFSFWYWNCGLESSVWGWDLSLLREGGNLQSRDSPIDSQTPHAVVGPACFVSLPLLSIWRWPLIHVPSCRTSVQPDLRQLPMMVVL